MMKKDKGSFSNILKVLRIVIGLALLYFAVKDANWADLKKAILSADLNWLWLALAMVLAGTALKIWRWSLLLGNFGLSKNWFTIARAYLVGQAANILLPFRGGEVIRTGMLVRGDVVVETSKIAGTIVIEKSLDLFALTAATLAVLPYLKEISHNTILKDLIFACGLVLVLLMAFMLISYPFWARIRQRLIHQPQKWAASIVEKGDQFIQSCGWLKNWKRVLPVIGLSILIWVFMWLNNLPVFRSVGLRADPWLGLFILVLVYIGLIPALTPGNIAPFYFFAQLGLVTFNVPSDEALAFAILLHAVVTLPVLMLGGISLLINKQTRETV
jgi:glycosyltransferase 2 family protein